MGYPERDGMKKVLQHHDMFGSDIAVGSYVVSYDRNTLDMFVVEKLTPKMVAVRRVKSRYRQHRYPKDLMVVDGEKATVRLLSC